MPPNRLRRDVPLAPLTTLELGGKAAFFLEAQTEAELLEALAWAKAEGLKVRVLGGGSNLVVGDAGVPDLVVQLSLKGISATENGGEVLVEAAAGEDWCDFVRHCAAQDWAGLECLAGIPGRVGASPIQNIGAYGQEVGNCIVRVFAIDQRSAEPVVFEAAECGFRYRHSRFKEELGRYIVTKVLFRLEKGGKAVLRYGNLSSVIADDASLSAVVAGVEAVRAQKSMVLSKTDENRRSAGSFFTNPIVGAEVKAEVFRRALDKGIVETESDIPCWSSNSDFKLAAAWLIERAGFEKGTRRGAVGLSSKHTLALVHHGGGSASELLAFADEIQQRVLTFWGVQLEMEPRRWNC